MVRQPIPPSSRLPQLDGAFDELGGDMATDPSSYDHHRRRRGDGRRRPLWRNKQAAAGGSRGVPRRRCAPKRPPPPPPSHSGARSALSRPPVSGKRRWIEDRNKQQELAHLMSRAKQANQARMYQREVEKHVGGGPVPHVVSHPSGQATRVDAAADVCVCCCTPSNRWMEGYCLSRCT